MGALGEYHISSLWRASFYFFNTLRNQIALGICEDGGNEW